MRSINSFSNGQSCGILENLIQVDKNATALTHLDLKRMAMDAHSSVDHA